MPPFGALAYQICHAAKGPKTGNAASNAKRDGPEEQRLTAKFLEAIKNPNWRERQRSSSSSSTIDLAGPDSADLDNIRPWTGAGASPPPVDSGKVEPDNVNNRKISVSDRQFNVRRESNSMSSTSYDECDSRPEKSDGTSESEIFCSIIRLESLDTSSSGDLGPRIIEVVPCDATRANSLTQPLDGSGHAQKLATLQRLGPAKAPDRESDPTERYQFAPLYFIRKQGMEETLATSTTVDRKSSRTPVASSERGTEKKRPTSSRGTADDEPSCGARGDPQKTSLDAKNVAFRKMLEKLRKGPAAVQPPPIQPLRETRDSGFSTRSGSDAAVEEASVDTHDNINTLLSVPASTREKRVQRGLTASDSAVVDYGSKRAWRPQAERSEDSGVADVGGAKSHDLNPKAREFLSFVPDGHLSPEKAEEQHLLRPLLFTSDNSQDGGKDVLSGVGTGAETQSANSAAILPPMPLMYSLQVPQVTPWLEAANNALGWAAKIAAACPPRLDSHLKGPQPTPSWFGGGGGLTQPIGLVSAPQMAGSGLHSLPARLHCPMPPTQMPLIPGPATQLGPPARPMPVPKPKLPNAGDQQAYEAYIEQRKAMEPGYALECRLRQQRRAKRTSNFPATHSKSGSSSDA
ncbi:hypothetical protein HRG_007008 [Hirsutella rhossiliensis]|uniref:Uncharacterized protein n=1 Tax=Hirsutella rhossiliensis TaxID=111463 RepID=A0A9P8MTS3_9HYPO|nr:uncharacterized protein HRG_07008 [Hirsutella rhossiliensis]KAH0961928.1 hypothetical protein HRG_07008 [Hirsutella rhossiliensis]